MSRWRRIMAAMLVWIGLAAVWAMPSLAATLRVGSRGGEVNTLQQALIVQGHLDDHADGIFGPKTKAALMRFQKQAGLAVDGIYGPASQGALLRSDRSASALPDDILWLARIIHAEAQGEPYQGQLAVGNVVMNRVASPAFPNTIYSVIFQYTGGVPQFSPVQDGSIWNQPGISSIRAAWASYRSQKPVGNCLFFFNPYKVPVNWISKNRQYYTMIGNHAFYH